MNNYVKLDQTSAEKHAGITGYVFLDTREYRFNEFLRTSEIPIDFSRRTEFIRDDSPWVFACPIVLTKDCEVFENMLCQLDDLLQHELGIEWEEGKREFQALIAYALGPREADGGSNGEEKSTPS